ncbi:hypothetical protein SAMN05216490_1581 [Mucilaginibacter mallensis]|uniref:Uncharacterized protein n=1 Tax=Mucilaginibacter mallensis TaxID=652787 RepID=A0A1H1U3N1_MUCMA|nr:hypothetical protein SAMN05216490_1581 [Mucilaginibacter mallensis]
MSKVWFITGTSSGMIFNSNFLFSIYRSMDTDSPKFLSKIKKLLHAILLPCFVLF